MHRPTLTDLPEMPVLPKAFALDDCNESDSEALAELLGAAFEDPLWTVERVNNALLRASDIRRTFAIRNDARIVATASLRYMPDRFPSAAYVHWVAVDPMIRGMRLGRIVSLAVLRLGVEQDLHDAWLETDDFRLPAIATYLGLGFLPALRGEDHSERWRIALLNLGRDPAHYL